MKENCPICYTNNTYLIDKRMSLHKCNNCDHTFTVIEKEKEEKYEADYFLIAHKNWFANPDFELFETVYSKIKQLLPVNKKIKLVDVGCGQGAFLRHVQKEFKDESPELTGIDIIDNDYPGINFISGDFLEMDFNENYNAITSFMVIEHVPNPHLFIRKIVDSTTNDGIVVINTINNGSLIYIIARLLNKLGFPTSYNRLYDHHHLQHFTNKSLKTLLEMEGLDLVKIKNHNYKLNAVDVPESNPITMKLYKIMVATMFVISIPFNLGHNQTLYCKKRNK